MSEKESVQDVIDSYRKRQQAAKKAPLMVLIAAILLIIGGVIIVYWFFSDSMPAIPFLSTDTPTPTQTATPTATGTATATPTITSTITDTPTITLTPTASGPFVYQVEEGDSIWTIAEKFQVDFLAILVLNNIDPANPNIQVGDKLTIPGPDTQLPTETALPTNLARGTRIDYQIQLGDSLLFIAIKFNSTVDAIKEENEIENENEIFVGQIISVPVNLVTPEPTQTSTPPGGTPAAPAGTPAVTPTT